MTDQRLARRRLVGAALAALLLPALAGVWRLAVPDTLSADEARLVGSWEVVTSDPGYDSPEVTLEYELRADRRARLVNRDRATGRVVYTGEWALAWRASGGKLRVRTDRRPADTWAAVRGWDFRRDHQAAFPLDPGPLDRSRWRVIDAGDVRLRKVDPAPARTP